MAQFGIVKCWLKLRKLNKKMVNGAEKITITVLSQLRGCFESIVVTIKCELPIFIYFGAKYMVLNELLMSRVLNLFLLFTQFLIQK